MSFPYLKFSVVVLSFFLQACGGGNLLNKIVCHPGTDFHAALRKMLGRRLVPSAPLAYASDRVGFLASWEKMKLRQ